MKLFFLYLEYEGASTSDAQDDADKALEQQDTEEGGDGVSSEGEKSTAATTGVEVNNFSFSREFFINILFHLGRNERS